MSISLVWTKKALSITGAFEGRGYGAVSGNFDGMGFSLGILQWNLGTGTFVREILKPARSVLPDSTINGFFPEPITPLIDMSPIEQARWARAKQTAQWKADWSKLMIYPAVIEIQDRAAQARAEKALLMAEHFGCSSERGFCFFFDVNVQNGSMKGLEPIPLNKQMVLRAYMMSASNKIHWMNLYKSGSLNNEQQILLQTAYRRARVASPTWAQDVLNRKGVIACGSGIVHGKNYSLTFEGET